MTETFFSRGSNAPPEPGTPPSTSPELSAFHERLLTPEHFPREWFLDQLIASFDRGGDYTVKSREEILAYLQDPFPRGWHSPASLPPQHQMLLFDHIISRYKGFEEAAYGTPLQRSGLLQYLQEARNEAFLKEIANESIALRNDLLRTCGVPGQTNEWGRFMVSDSLWNAPFFESVIRSVRVQASFRCDFDNDKYRNFWYLFVDNRVSHIFAIRCCHPETGEWVPWDDPNSVREICVGTEEEVYETVPVIWH